MKAILLYDGTCALCHGAVRFILRHERAPSICFAAQQSELGREMLSRAGFQEAPESLVLVLDPQVLTEADAVFEICRYLRAPWRWLRGFRFLPPSVPRAVYRWIARNRKRHFGVREVCVLPSPGHAERFLS